MLDAVPDVRHALKTADDAELAEIVRAFDVTITYDKAGQRLDPAATITPNCFPTSLTTASARGTVTDDCHSGGTIRSH